MCSLNVSAGEWLTLQLFKHYTTFNFGLFLFFLITLLLDPTPLEGVGQGILQPTSLVTNECFRYQKHLLFHISGESPSVFWCGGECLMEESVSPVSLYGIHMPLFLYVLLQPIVLGMALLWSAMDSLLSQGPLLWRHNDMTVIDMTPITDCQSIDSLLDSMRFVKHFWEITPYILRAHL